MKRKIIAAAVAALGCAMMSSASMAGYVGQVVLEQDTSHYTSGQGGEFNATLDYAFGITNFVAPQLSPVQQPSIAPASYPNGNGGFPLGSPAGNGDPTGSDPTIAVFQTFCIQQGSNDVTFNPGTFYAATFNGGAASLGSGKTETLQPITEELFDAFWHGTLAGQGYNYTPSSGRSFSAGELQAAIWAAQGDDGAVDSGPGTDLLNSAAIAAAAGQAGVGGNIALAESFYTFAASNKGQELGLVQVLGLYDSQADAETDGSAGIAQAQLVETVTGAPNFMPLPGVAGQLTVMLGAVGLFGLVRRSRTLA